VAFGMALLVGLMALVLLSPLFTQLDPLAVNPSATFQTPRQAPPMGTDNLGRDLFARFVFGGRISLVVGFLAVLMGAVVGVVLGMAAGFYGGWLDAGISWLIEVLLAFPGILLALVIVTILGPGARNVIIAVGIGFAPSFMRMTRGSVLAAREADYVSAARATGVPNGRIMRRHILPNIARPLLVLATIGVGGAILEGAALSFLGMGVQPPDPEWGAMLSAAQQYVRRAWWMGVFPGMGIFVCVLAINLIGDGLSDVVGRPSGK
jgi:peptide/nickel transport system permease protein